MARPHFVEGHSTVYLGSTKFETPTSHAAQESSRHCIIWTLRGGLVHFSEIKPSDFLKILKMGMRGVALFCQGTKLALLHRKQSRGRVSVVGVVLS